MSNVWRFDWKLSWPEVWDASFQAMWGAQLGADSGATVYHLPALVRAWVETEGSAHRAEPFVGVAEDDRGTRVVLFWVRLFQSGRFLHRTLVSHVGGSFFGYHDPLIAPRNEIDWPGFWREARASAVGGGVDQVLIRCMHTEHAQGPLTEPFPELNPILPLAGFTKLDDVLARCSSNHRGDVRRRLRRLGEQGALTLWTPAATEVEAASLDFKTHFLPAYAKVWDVRPEGNMFHRPGVREYAERVLAEGLRNGWAHYSVLRVAGQAIAWHLGLLYRDQLYWWIPTHDPAWESFSPGKALLARLVEFAIARRWTHLHFLTGGHRYKLDWNPEPLELRTVRWYAPTPKAVMLESYDKVFGTNLPAKHSHEPAR